MILIEWIPVNAHTNHILVGVDRNSLNLYHLVWLFFCSILRKLISLEYTENACEGHSNKKYSTILLRQIPMIHRVLSVTLIDSRLFVDSSTTFIVCQLSSFLYQIFAFSFTQCNYMEYVSVLSQLDWVNRKEYLKVTKDTGLALDYISNICYYLSKPI